MQRKRETGQKEKDPHINKRRDRNKEDEDKKTKIGQEKKNVGADRRI